MRREMSERLRRASVRRRTWVAASLAAVAVLAAAGLLLVERETTTAGSPPAGVTPEQLTAGTGRVGHFEYVVVNGALDVYDIDRENRLVQRLEVPQIGSPHGVVADPGSARLYVSYGGQGGRGDGPAWVLSYDLLRDRVLWSRRYEPGIDSIAVTRDGETLYVPAGEDSDSGRWALVDTGSGDVRGAVEAGAGAHNTVVSLDGRYAFLAGTKARYLTVVDVATNRVVRRIGPLVSGGRPFTVNGSNTLAFTTSRGLLGFQVSSILTGAVLYTVPVPGYTYDPAAFGDRSPCHGISMSPDERELYLIDTPNGAVHVFDISGVPASRPRYEATISLAHPPPNDGWLQHSRDGRYVYVGRAGDVIDTTTRTIVAHLPPLAETADFLEIDWRDGRPVATTSRYGLGYRLSG